MKRAIIFIATVLLIVTGCGPSEKELQQQAAQKAAAAARVKADFDAGLAKALAKEEVEYQAALAKREKDGADCETLYWCGDQAHWYTGSRCEKNNDNLEESTKLDACLKAVWDPSTPNNRVIKAGNDFAAWKDQQKIREVLASDPYAFCGMIEGAACRH
jgi:hypothetical protein